MKFHKSVNLTVRSTCMVLTNYSEWHKSWENTAHYLQSLTTATHEHIPWTIQQKHSTLSAVCQTFHSLTGGQTEDLLFLLHHLLLQGSRWCYTYALTPVDCTPTSDWLLLVWWRAGVVRQDAVRRSRVRRRGTLASLSTTDVPMSAIRQMVLGCVSVRSHQAPAIRPKRPTK